MSKNKRPVRTVFVTEALGDQTWTPVKEKPFPDTSGKVWITVKYPDGDRVTREAAYSSHPKPHFYYSTGFPIIGEVVAWMPKVFPRAYKE